MTSRLFSIPTYVVLGLLAGCTLQDTPRAAASPPRPDSTALGTTLRAAYSGMRALETVAFLDRYVRWPGNPGFDAAIDHIAARLAEAGYEPEDTADPDAPLTYRIEEYPMDRPAWEPHGASVTIVGEDAPLLDFGMNRNMVATNSFSTPSGGIEAVLVDAGSGSTQELDALDIRGRVVLVDGSLSRVFRTAVQRGAVGVMAYSLPDYLQPQKNRHSIQFRSVSYDPAARAWGIALSTDARDRLHEALALGPVRVHVEVDAAWTENPIERTVVADIRGLSHPDERIVFSAHVQEPGANDNASGVGAQVEMARVAAQMFRDGSFAPERSMTFLWGDEIRSTGRYVEQDSVRAKGILWGISLDMVGEDTEKTGGTFLIEKMPDPSAIWTRGKEKHTEWGGRPLTKGDMTPHYLNDVVLNRAREQAAAVGWTVKTNPYEGGSDHVPFLRADIASVLLWHFTDHFYHTDRDRIEMVSADELENSGVTALSTGIMLVSADGDTARQLVSEVQTAALERIEAEFELSQSALAAGSPRETESDVLQTWAAWYDGALASMTDIEVGGASAETLDAIRQARLTVRQAGEQALASL